MEDTSEESRENKTPIRWMWKKALKSLKTKDRDKDKEKDKDKDKAREDRGADKSSSERDDKRAYSRMVGGEDPCPYNANSSSGDTAQRASGNAMSCDRLAL